MGFMKCVDTTHELAEISLGSFVVAAYASNGDGAFVNGQYDARWAYLGQFWGISNLRLGISGMASITKLTSDSRSMDMEGERFERPSSTCSWVIGVGSYVVDVVRKWLEY